MHDAVVVNEAKSSPLDCWVDAFLNRLKDFFGYFPEYAGRELIPVFSDFDIPDDMVASMDEKGVYAMAMRAGIMDILNPPPRRQPS